MAFKIYVSASGNQFYIFDTVEDRLFEGLAKDIRVRKHTESSDRFYFDNVNGWDDAKYADFADIVDEALAPFADLATFVTWYEANTGFNSAGSSAIPTSDIFNGGWFDYNDLATATTPINYIGGSGLVDITNDELGAFTNKTFKPTNVDDIWDAINQQFDFSQLSIGDMVDIRLDLEITTTQPNQEVKVVFELAIGGTPYQILFAQAVPKSAGVFDMNRYNGIYIGDSNTKDNPAKFRITSPDNLTVIVRGWFCKIILLGA